MKSQMSRQVKSVEDERFLLVYFVLFCLAVLRIEHRAYYILGKCFSAELFPSPLQFLNFEAGYCLVAQARLQVAVFLL